MFSNNTVSRFVPRTLAAMLVVMACLAMATNVQAAIVAADIDHNWNFDDGFGAAAVDRFGDADGELKAGGGAQGGTAAWSTDAQVGAGALDFTGGVVDISSISGTYLNDFSVSMWVKADSAGGGNYGRFMVDRSDVHGVAEWLWHIQTDGSTYMGVTYTSGIGHFGAAGSVAFNTYQHVTFTISEADVEGDVTVNQYVNGALAGEAVTSGSPTTGSEFMGIGNNRTYAGESNNRWFDGLIDEVVIFNRELTGTEVGDFYDDGGDVASIPEPCMLQLLIIGGLLVLGWRRLR